jgi:TRAP-type C4-dicarboxylate transport system permease small subunit
MIVRIYDGVFSVLAACAGVTVVAVFVSIVADVLMRVGGLQPPAWTITYVEYALLYFTMFCAPYLVRHKGHVVIESLVSVLPGRVSNVMAKITYLLCFAGAAVFAYQSVLLLSEALASQRLDVRGVDIPMWILFLPMPLSFGLIATEFLRYLFGRDTIYTYDLTNAKDSI